MFENSENTEKRLVVKHFTAPFYVLQLRNMAGRVAKCNVLFPVIGFNRLIYVWYGFWLAVIFRNKM